MVLSQQCDLPEEALMTISYLKNIGLRRRTLAAFAACGLTIAASQGHSVRAQAENATADYVAPLDMTSAYPGPFEHPEFLPEALVRRVMAAPDTTGVNSASLAGRKEAAASQHEANAGADISDDKYNR
jgi:hypothetical protein